MSDFFVFPAIDLRHGMVVRLKEGDPAQQTSYSSDPRHTAEHWLEAGAQWLHVINLDGAFGNSDQKNLQALENILSIAQKHLVPVQFGGGMRSLDSIERAFSLGVSRVIIGTAAINQPEILLSALKKWGEERIVVSLDAKDGFIKVHGWKTASDTTAIEASKQLKLLGVKWLVFTDISRDGLQTGVNVSATQEISHTSGLRVIASGGVKNMQDIHAVKNAGLPGVIVGRALYEGNFDLAQLFSFSKKGGN